jgi:hypothetical protein
MDQYLETNVKLYGGYALAFYHIDPIDNDTLYKWKIAIWVHFLSKISQSNSSPTPCYMVHLQWDFFHYQMC